MHGSEGGLGRQRIVKRVCGRVLEKSDQARIIAEGGALGATLAKNHNGLSQNHNVQPTSFVYRVEVGVDVET